MTEKRKNWNNCRTFQTLFEGYFAASSDLQELTGICDRLIVLQHGRVQYHAAADQYAHTDLVRLLRTPPTESGSYSNFQ